MPESAFDDFWQGVECLVYALDGEPAANRRERIERYLAHTPASDPDESFEAFRRYAVLHLLKVWADGPIETESQKHWARGIASKLGLDEIKGSDSTH